MRDRGVLDADVVIAAGQRTGDITMRDEIEAIKSAADLSAVVSSGVTLNDAGWILSICDGVKVVSFLKREGVSSKEIDPDRMQRLMARARTGK